MLVQTYKTKKLRYGKKYVRICTECAQEMLVAGEIVGDGENIRQDSCQGCGQSVWA